MLERFKVQVKDYTLGPRPPHSPYPLFIPKKHIGRYSGSWLLAFFQIANIFLVSIA